MSAAPQENNPYGWSQEWTEEDSQDLAALVREQNLDLTTREGLDALVAWLLEEGYVYGLQRPVMRRDRERRHGAGA